MSRLTCFRNGLSGSCVTFESNAHRSRDNCPVRSRSRIDSTMETYVEALSAGFDKLDQLTLTRIQKRYAAAVEGHRRQRLAHDLGPVIDQHLHARLEVVDAIADVIQASALRERPRRRRIGAQRTDQ